MQPPRLRCAFNMVESTPTKLVIKDLNHGKSVTNDVEAVVLWLMHYKFLHVGKTLWYYDSENNLDQIAFTKNGFTRFVLGPRRSAGAVTC